MKPALLWPWAVALVSTAVGAADPDDGYIGYRLDRRGDLESAVYETANTPPGAVLAADPDVYLNASVSVGHIGIEVDNITAKVNLDAQVLKLLRLNAGVDASIDRVRLTIENVSAKVELEARLGNVVAMVDDVLSSIDLNPLLATLGQVVNNTLDGVGDILDGGDGSSSSSSSGSVANKRSEQRLSGSGISSSYTLEHNILYSVNNYSGRTHTNRVLGQDGNLYDVFLDNDGTEQEGGGRRVVGSYAADMRFSGHNRTVAGTDGRPAEFELQYVYAPFAGLEVTCWVYVDGEGRVTRTRVVSEAFGGGTSTISNDSESE